MVTVRRMRGQRRCAPAVGGKWTWLEIQSWARRSFLHAIGEIGTFRDIEVHEASLHWIADSAGGALVLAAIREIGRTAIRDT